MRDFNFRFFEGDWPNDIRDLLRLEVKNIPARPGAYALGTSDGTNFNYPWGSSPIYYIGQSSDLRKRLGQHRRYILNVRKPTTHDDKRWWPRYQYGEAFGATVAWFLPAKPESARGLEVQLMDDFYECYGAMAVANAAWSDSISKLEAKDSK